MRLTICSLFCLPLASCTLIFGSLTPGNDAFEVGDGPLSVAVGDLNRDGTLDIVTANLNSATLSVLLGDPDVPGSFQEEIEVDTAVAATAVVMEDLNRDGALDLAVSVSPDDSLPGQVVVLLGIGDGSFLSPVVVEVGRRPVALVAADINRDGILDLATANFFSQDLSLLSGQGDGTFLTQSLPLLDGFEPDDLIAADINRDGFLDLVTVNKNNQDSSSITIFSGAEGTLSTPQSFDVAPGLISVVAEDLNQDGFLDLAAVSNLTNEVFVLLNDQGVFAPPQTLSTGPGPIDIIAKDLDRDGFLDLATANEFADEISVFRGVGNGSFVLVDSFFTNSGPLALAAADLDRSGVLDLVAANFNDGDVTVLLNNLSFGGTPLFEEGVPLSAGFDLPDVVAKDFDRNGRLDLAVTDFGTGGILFFSGDGNGGFSSPQLHPANGSPVGLTAGDFNRDGILDLACVNHDGSDTASVLLGNGLGFGAPQTFATGSFPFDVITADFNRDGVLDLATTNSQSQDVSILLGQGDGTFSLTNSFLTGGLNPSIIVAADLDQNGVLDLAVTNNDFEQAAEDSLTILRGNPDGTFVPLAPLPMEDLPNGLAVADFNLDGILDLVVSHENSPNLVTLQGEGDGTFLQGSVPSPSNAPRILADDLNANGGLDLILLDRDQNSVTFLEELGLEAFSGDEAFLAQSNTALVRAPQALTAGDFNGDGFSDVVVTTGEDGGAGSIEILLSAPSR